MPSNFCRPTLLGLMLLLPCQAREPLVLTPSIVEDVRGTLTLEVDLKDNLRSLIHVRESIPVHPGPVTLVYPKWGPGWHKPIGKPGRLAGLHFMANGKDLVWQRDDVDIFAFHLDVPAGCEKLEVRSMSEFCSLRWAEVLLYPEGWSTSATLVQGHLRLPEVWQFASALALQPSSPGLQTDLGQP